MSDLKDFNSEETEAVEFSAMDMAEEEDSLSIENSQAGEEDPDGENTRSEDDPADADYEKLLSGAFGRTYVSAEDRFRDLKESAKALLICGIAMIVLGCVGFLNLISLPFNEMSLSLFIAIGAGLLFYSVITSRNANIARQQIAGEKKRRNEIIEWFEATYTAPVIDNRIYAQETEKELGPEILDLKRIGMIQSFIQREFPMEAEGFVDNICEELFEKLFQNADA